MQLKRSQRLEPKLTEKEEFKFKKRRHLRKKPNGIVFIQSTQNNTIITCTDLKGNTKYWASGGSCGFKGTRRSTTYAAQAAAQKVAKDARTLGNFAYVQVQMKGLSRGKQSAVKGLAFGGLKILQIQDTTGLPHNGCRQPKKRRT